MNVTRTTNPNGTYRYTLSNGEIITKGSKRKSEWATIYRLTEGFGTNHTGDIAATLHARQDLAAKGSRDMTGAGWVIIEVVQVIDGDQPTEEEQAQPSAQATSEPTFMATWYVGDTEIESSPVASKHGPKHAARLFFRGEGHILSDRRKDGDGLRWTLTDRHGLPAGSVLVQRAND